LVNRQPSQFHPQQREAQETVPPQKKSNEKGIPAVQMPRKTEWKRGLDKRYKKYGETTQFLTFESPFFFAFWIH
jgi:hypothetical protein